MTVKTNSSNLRRQPFRGFLKIGFPVKLERPLRNTWEEVRFLQKLQNKSLRLCKKWASSRVFFKYLAKMFSIFWKLRNGCFQGAPFSGCFSIHFDFVSMSPFKTSVTSQGVINFRYF